MKILVLNNDVMERTVIRQVLQVNGHEIITAENSETAMQLLQEGEIRFVIVDRSTTDADQQQFIRRIRNAKPPYYIYILLVATKVQDTDVTAPNTGADDYLHKPIIPIELKSRMHIGERILGLGDNLVNAKGSLNDIALFDPLTNMLNQKAFITLFRGELERARRGQAPLSLIALNIDNFNVITEKFGDEIGKDVMTLVAQAIREKSRPYDDVGHYQNDTFLIPLPGVIGQDAEKIAKRIINGITNTNITLLDGTAVNVTISAGIVSSIRITASMEIDMLIDKAKEAVTRARQDGESQVHTIFL